MSAGLSMASVNKIKELAESRDYSVAVDILDAQDLEKSLNPQFVRICGEVYENVGRYADARKQYVRAHIMADGNSKVIQSLVVLYLKRGFKELAQKYYEQFIFIEKNSPRKLSDMEYIMKKANKEITDEMYETLYPYYRDNMDEEWSYELILLSIMMGKLDGLDILVSDYLATFKNSKRIEYIEEAFMDREKAKKYFDIFSDEEVADDSSEEDEVRALEAEQLEKDYYIRNPKEPEILLMVDDLQDELTDKQKRKAQRKNRKELLKSMRKEAQENSEEAEGEEGAQTAEDTETAEGAEAEEVAPVGESVKRSLKDFIKRKFRRENPEKDEEESEEKAESDEKKDEAKADSEEKKAEDKKPDEKPETDVKKEETKAEEKKPEDKSESEAKPEVIVTADETIVETEKTVETEKPEAEKAEETKVEAADSDDDKIEVEVVKADEPEVEKAEGSEEDDMRELKPDTSIDDLITYDFDDGFAPESETIAELDDSSFDFSNPFDSISAYKKDEEEKRSSEAETFGKTLDDLRIELEINNIDESTSDHEPAVEESVEETIIDVPVEETVETVEEPVETVFEETVEEVAEVVAETPVETIVEETVEAVVEPAETVFEETVEEVAEPAAETSVETIVEETVEAVEEPAGTVFEETVEKVQETVADTPVEETVETVEESADTKTDDYPKFTSSLFPDLNKEKKEVKNEFDDVVKSESDKLEERLRKEAELQKQAEELLASLGIKL